MTKLRNEKKVQNNTEKKKKKDHTQNQEDQFTLLDELSANNSVFF